MVTDLDRLNRRIGATVRRLRKDRLWTLAELARHLELSESRLSELERGAGSFSAGHLLVLFRLFQVGPEDFIEPDDTRDPVVGSLQTALVRFGARHLVADDSFVIRREHERPGELVQDVLIRHPTARFVTALPPVLIVRLSEISFPSVQHAVVQAGVPNRWGWLLEQFLEALESINSSVGSVRWRRDSRRARTVAEHFLPGIPRPSDAVALDLLDPDLRSPSSVKAAVASAPEIDRRWRVLSRLGTDDFLGPMEVLRDSL